MTYVKFKHQVTNLMSFPITDVPTTGPNRRKLDGRRARHLLHPARARQRQVLRLWRPRYAIIAVVETRTKYNQKYC